MFKEKKQKNGALLVAVTFLFLTMNSIAFAAPAASTPVQYGYRDFTFPSGTGSNNEPTGEKPESKLWWNDGFWWGSLWSVAGKSYRIFQLDPSTQSWIDTGTNIDTRIKSKADALWDGQHLYVASHIFNLNDGVPTALSDRGMLFRYSYSTTTKKYTLDSGFPFAITGGKSETLVIDKDSTGQLWVTYVENHTVMVNHSLNGDDRSWATPFVLPVGAMATVTSDDISSVITYNNFVGIMWSNQLSPKTMYFAAHPVGSSDSTWTKARAYSISGDDHINLKTLETDPAGNLFAVVKTAKSAGIIVLLVCKQNLNRCKSESDWQSYIVYDITYNPTRPILLIDTSNRELYIFTRNEFPDGTGGIFYKKASIDNIQFPTGMGQPFILNAADPENNNPTSTKQNVNNTTGLVVLSSDARTKYYMHNMLNLGSAPPSPTPTQTTIATATLTPAPTTSTPTASPTPTSTPVSSSGSTIKNITFENGALVDPLNGVERVVGAVGLDSASAVSGVYSARFTNIGSTYLEQRITAVNDLYVSIKIKLNSLPSGNARFLLISDAGTSVGNLQLLTNGAVRLRSDTTNIGSATSPLQLNTVYRLAIHQKIGTGGNAVLEAYLAPAGQPFGAPFASLNTGAWVTQADRIRLGETNSIGLDLWVDDIVLDNAVLQ